MSVRGHPHPSFVIAMIADTHMPKGKRRLPDACVEKIRGAEVLIHAGDFSAASVLEELRQLCPVVLAVHGNVDDAELRRELPESLELEIGGRTLALLHDTGPAKGRLARMRARFPEADALVFGHSHLPLHEEADGFQIFNPGSPTERRRAPRPSMGLLHPTASGLRFEHVWLG
ncbi:MAG TPA: metallophosphoesterase family protein [Solirubrobacterales bacterium]|nr:metallophosphoesterase family protein [Solirubrobacterales bacterium]